MEENTLLDNYYLKASKLETHKDGEIQQFIESSEWHYIQYPLGRNVDLLKNLNSIGLLEKNVNICDCGIGLGTTMYDLYLQSKEIKDLKFTFTGIEKWKPYIDYFNDNLSVYWDNNLKIIHSDIIDCDYSNWNFIYIFQPFKTAGKTMPFYKRVLETAKPNTLIFGIDQFNVMMYGEKYEGLIELFKKTEKINCGQWTLLRKI
jgi:hypothetical protein